MVPLFLLAASHGGRGSACSQDSGSDMGHLWFVVQIVEKMSYKTIVTAYYQQYQLLLVVLREHSSLNTKFSSFIEQLTCATSKKCMTRECSTCVGLDSLKNSCDGKSKLIALKMWQLQHGKKCKQPTGTTLNNWTEFSNQKRCPTSATCTELDNWTVGYCNVRWRFSRGGDLYRGFWCWSKNILMVAEKGIHGVVDGQSLTLGGLSSQNFASSLSNVLWTCRPVVVTSCSELAE